MADKKEHSGITSLPEESMVGAAVDSKVIAIPNSIRLVDTEIPLSRAKNIAELSGKFLFQQLYSSCHMCGFECLLCHKDCRDTDSLSSLTTHYCGMHGLNVVHDVAEFDEDDTFICVPPLGERRRLNPSCDLCGDMLKDFPDVCDHYSKAHGKAVKVVLSSELQGLYNYFYCSVCLYPSSDFKAHLQHMEAVHGLKTNLCQFCLYCTPCEDVLHEHVQDVHMSLCPACSERVHEDHMTEHIVQTHAIQIGDTWVCKACRFPYVSTDVLSLHLRICKVLCACGKVVYGCPTCSPTFSSKPQMVSTVDDSNLSAAAEMKEQIQEEKYKTLPCCEDVSHLQKNITEMANNVKVTEATVTVDAMQDTEEKEQLSIIMDHACSPSECMLVCAVCFGTFCCEVTFVPHQCSLKQPQMISIVDDSNLPAAAEMKEQIQEEKYESPPCCEDASHLRKNITEMANNVNVTEATVTVDAMQDTEEKEQLSIVMDHACPPSECKLVCTACLDTFCCEVTFVPHQCSLKQPQTVSTVDDSNLSAAAEMKEQIQEEKYETLLCCEDVSHLQKNITAEMANNVNVTEATVTVDAMQDTEEKEQLSIVMDHACPPSECKLVCTACLDTFCCEVTLVPHQCSLKQPQMVSTVDDSNLSAAAEMKEQIQEEKYETLPCCEDASHLQKNMTEMENNVSVTEATVTVGTMQGTEEKEQLCIVMDHACSPLELKLVCTACLDTFCCEVSFLPHRCSLKQKSPNDAFSVI